MRFFQIKKAPVRDEKLQLEIENCRNRLDRVHSELMKSSKDLLENSKEARFEIMQQTIDDVTGKAN